MYCVLFQCFIRLGINGRVDDVINVSGHRLGTAEIERYKMHEVVLIY